MRPPIRPIFCVLSLLAMPVAAALAQPPNPLQDIRANRWSDATAAAATFADPVAAKLVLYYRLLDPGAATPAEIAAFMRDNPDWPNQTLLERRRQEAIAADPDDADVLTQCCAPQQPTEAAALLRCATALANAGRASEADDDARQAWIAGITDPTNETAFLQRWASIVTPDDQWARFQHLAWHDTQAAARQGLRLDPDRQKIAAARLALIHNDPNADTLVTALPASAQTEPGLMLERARWLRHNDREADALALWKSAGANAQAAVHDTAPADLPLFWAEREILARKLLQQGDAAGAYALTSDHGAIAPRQELDADFLAGFIALRKLHDPAAAIPHFQDLAARSKAAITQGRAYYWLGRAEAAAGHDPKPDYAKAAEYPTTFYGQLAALALGDSAAELARQIDALRDPTWNRAAALAFASHEVVRAAAWLVAWGDPYRARAFLLRMDDLAPDPAERAIAADFALRVGLPDTAVFIARRMGRDGLMLPQAGWPTPFSPPAGPLDPAVALGIMRQESSFDVGAVSSSGARGLMQLMPFTAAAVARQIGLRTSLPSLTADPAHNMQLGTAYLEQMLRQFGGSLPLAVAAYNAGPARVQQWLAENGDPRPNASAQPVDMLDWLEQIPVEETRNYVQRVLENVTVYRASRGEANTTQLAQWTK
jgi:soluble lytic murein transglycosylase